MEGDFELMSDLPIHRGEASMSVNDVDEEVKVLSDYTKQVTRITILVAIASLVVAALSMWWCASIVAYAAFCIPFVTAPAVVIQRLRIQWMPSKCSLFFLIMFLLYSFVHATCQWLNFLLFFWFRLCM